MASFSVGDIEGRLTLDRSPFTDGLRLARQQADAFERNDVTAKVDVDTAHADEQLAATQVELDRLDHTRATPTVDVDTRRASQGIGLLGTAIIALGPAALAAGGLAAGAIAPIAAGTLGVAAVALPALKNIHDAATKTGAAQQKALAAIGPGGMAAVTAFKALETAWHGFQAQVNPAVLGLLATSFQAIGHTLPAFAPFITGTAGALTRMVSGLAQLGPAFGRAFTATLPIVNMVSAGVVHLAAALAHFTQGQGFEHFIAYVVQNGPLLFHTLGQVAGVFVSIGVAAAPLLPALLHIIGAFAQLLSLVLRLPGIGPALVAFAAIGVTALQVGKAVIWLRDSWAIAVPVIEGLMGGLGTAASALLANPIIAAAAAIVAGLAYIVTHWQQTVKFLEGLWQGALDAYNATIGQIPGLHIGPDHPNVLQQTVDQALQARKGGGGDFSGPGSGSFGGGDFSAADLTAGGLPSLTAPTLPVGKAPKMPKLPPIRVPKLGGTVAGAPLAIAAPLGVPRGRTRTGSTGSSAPHATGGTVQDITGGGLSGPRSVAHDFSLGPDIIGQTVKFRHSPDYGQRTQDKHTSAVEKNTRALQKVSDVLGKDRPKAHIEIKTPDGKTHDIEAQSRKRGRTTGKR